jgi:hypothetical protein
MLFALTVLLLAALLFLAFILIRLFSLEAPQTRQPVQPAHRPGIWFCSHRARRYIPFQHMYLKITPRDPSWATRYPLVFVQKDAMGVPFCTLGAGPWEGKLKLEFNRSYDLQDPVSFEEAVPSGSIEQENGRIATLLMTAGRYVNPPDFVVVPGVTGTGYNCNSIMATLAHRAGFPLPEFSDIFLLCIGARAPLPESHFP